MLLENRINNDILKKRLHSENFIRRTISFYKYVNIDDPALFRDEIYKAWFKLNCFGRIYVAKEGINAQMSVPEHNMPQFLNHLQSIAYLKDVPVKYAIVDDGKSFYKLTIRVRPKIVADGLDDREYDFSKVGKHLNAFEFHELVDAPGTIVVDMRNNYESEIGRFTNAICPDAETFRDAIKIVLNDLKDQKDKQILLYCTGGIRCEKAGSVLLHHGFENVGQLYGGIIEYAQQIKNAGLTSKFTGKNFVFDERLGETVDGKIISKCHQCGNPADSHTNCSNNSCHVLFIQCAECAQKYKGTCSYSCMDVITNRIAC